MAGAFSFITEKKSNAWVSIKILRSIETFTTKLDSQYKCIKILVHKFVHSDYLNDALQLMGGKVDAFDKMEIFGIVAITIKQPLLSLEMKIGSNLKIKHVII